MVTLQLLAPNDRLPRTYALVGLGLGSEHENSYCVTIELSEVTGDIQSQLEANFIEKASRIVSKGARPDYVRFERIPRNFKGAILYAQLKQDFLDSLKSKRRSIK